MITQPKYKLRTLFLLVIAIGMVASLYRSCIQPILGRRQFLAQLEAMGALISCEQGNRPYRFVNWNQSNNYHVFQPLSVRFPYGADAIDDDMLIRICSTLPKLLELRIPDAQITDRSVREISNLKQLRYLDITNADFSQEGIQALASLDLHTLHASGTPVTDELLLKLASSPSVTAIDVRSTSVTLEGLKKAYRLNFGIRFDTAHHDEVSAALNDSED